MPRRNAVDGRSGQCQACWQAARRAAVELTASPVELAWLAGLLEGEGSFRLQHKDRRYSYGAYGYPMVHLAMTDEDVVRRACSTAGVGRVRGPYRPAGRDANPSYKSYWTWDITRIADATTLMTAILPFMGARRTAQINEVLSKAGFHGPADEAVLSGPLNHQGGELSGNAKLTREAAEEIRRRAAAGEARRPLADEFGINLRTVFRILSQEAWR